MSSVRLIAGLGNPGQEHARQRHNAGFWFADALAKEHSVSFVPDGKLFGSLAKIDIGGNPIWLIKPATFMNRSAQSVLAALRFWKIEPEELLVVHDELDLAPGTVRLKIDGGHGGQNGLRDLLTQLGHGRFQRLRVGIGHPGHKDKVTSWVLGRATTDDEAAILRAIDSALGVLPALVRGDINAAMKQLHTKVP